MRLTEQEFLGLMAKKKITRLILPFRLPTWNQLLAMDRWQRKKVRDMIKGAVVSISTTRPRGSLILMDDPSKPALTDSWLQEYCETIVPKSSMKLLNRRKSLKRKKP
jgi:hypothetical protein